MFSTPLTCCWTSRHRLIQPRVCAGIIGRLDGRWRDLGILGNSRRKRDNADERDDDTDHAGKDRRSMKK